MEIKLQCGDTIAIPDGCKATIKDRSVVFEKEFKDGEVLVNKDVIFIYRKQETQEATYYVCTYAEEIKYGKSTINRYAGYIEEACRATEEEKQQLFDKMKEHGLRWNAEEKRVEKIRWRASSDERYYYIKHLLDCHSDIEESHIFDEDRWKVGNYFRTGEEAEEAIKRIKETLRNYHEEIE